MFQEEAFQQTSAPSNCSLNHSTDTQHAWGQRAVLHQNCLALLPQAGFIPQSWLFVFYHAVACLWRPAIPQNTLRLHPPQFLWALHVYWDEQWEAENLKHPMPWKRFRDLLLLRSNSFSVLLPRCPLQAKLYVSGKDHPEASVQSLCSHLPPALRLSHAAARGGPSQYIVQTLHLLCSGKKKSDIWVLTPVFNLVANSARSKTRLVNLISPFPFAGVQPHWQERVGPTSGADWKTDNQG